MSYFDTVTRRLDSAPLVRLVGLIGLVFAAAVAVPVITTRATAGAFLPHLYCYLANPSLVWTHVTSDAVIGLSYLGISLTLLYIVHHSRSAVPYSWLVLAFGLFIVACGATHVMEVITIWRPVYWISASIKVLTAVASLATAIALPIVTPTILQRITASAESEERRVRLEVANTELDRLNREMKDFDDLKDTIVAQQAARIGTWQWNIKTGENRWSTAVELMHGLAAGSYDGKYRSWEKTIYSQDQPRVMQAVSDALSSGHYEVEYRTIRPDGTHYWTAARGIVRYDASGAPELMLGICMDVTSRKHSEEALVRAEKLAAAGRLAATVAHEINNPLEAVTNLVYLARTGQVDPKPLLESAERELSRMAVITRQTLGFYRDSGTPTDVDVVRVLEGVGRLYSSKMENKKVQLRMEAEIRPTLRAREGDLYQLFGNLISNAIDASRSGGQVVLAIRESRDDGVEVEVIDFGEGIRPEIAERIFEPFFTTKAEFGTGLGLWVSRQVVERMGGKISFDSDNGSGTRFRVYFPAAARSTAAA